MVVTCGLMNDIQSQSACYIYVSTAPVRYFYLMEFLDIIDFIATGGPSNYALAVLTTLFLSGAVENFAILKPVPKLL